MSLHPPARIRAARPDEIEQIRQIERLAGARMIDTAFPELAEGEPNAAELLLERLEAGGLLVACDAADTPIAQVTFRLLDDAIYVEQIDVLPDHAGRRIGAALLEAVAEDARRLGVAAMELSTFQDVPFNAPYYRRLGFAELSDRDLSPALRAIRAEHVARGLDETRRVFMRRSV